MAATHYFSLYALDIIHHHCCVSGLYYTRLSFRWYGDFGPIPHIVLSLSVAQGGLTLCISLVSIYVRGLVPLHNACSYGHYEVAELLVKVIHLRECFSCSWCMKDLPVVWNVIHLFTLSPHPLTDTSCGVGLRDGWHFRLLTCLQFSLFWIDTCWFTP